MRARSSSGRAGRGPRHPRSASSRESEAGGVQRAVRCRGRSGRRAGARVPRHAPSERCADGGCRGQGRGLVSAGRSSRSRGAGRMAGRRSRRCQECWVSAARDRLGRGGTLEPRGRDSPRGLGRRHAGSSLHCRGFRYPPGRVLAPAGPGARGARNGANARPQLAGPPLERWGCRGCWSAWLGTGVWLCEKPIWRGWSGCPAGLMSLG